MLSFGLTTRNLGAAMAPLLAVPEPDQQAALMGMLALPPMVLFARLGLQRSGCHLTPSLKGE